MGPMRRLSNLFSCLSSASSRSAPSWPFSPSPARSPTRSTHTHHPDDGQRTGPTTPSPPAPSPRRRRHLRAGLRQRRLRLRPRRQRPARLQRRGRRQGRLRLRLRHRRAGHIVTNDHVVEDADEFTVRFGEDGDPIPAKLVGNDPSTDLAVLKIDPAGRGRRPAARTRLRRVLRAGQAAIAIGSPFGLEGTVTTGIVSALNRKIQAPNGFAIPGVVQTDAAINPGNSGGPLLDAAGPRDRRQLADRLLRAAATPASASPSRSTPSATSSPSFKDGKIDRAYLGALHRRAPRDARRAGRHGHPRTPGRRRRHRTGDLIVSLRRQDDPQPVRLSLAVLDEAARRRGQGRAQARRRHPTLTSSWAAPEPGRPVTQPRAARPRTLMA